MAMTLDGTLNQIYVTAATPNITLTSAGYPLTPNRPAFHAWGGSAQSGTDFIVQFPTVGYNNGSNYNASTYRFTAPIAGVYFFTFSGMANSATYNRFGLRKNGVLYGDQKFSANQVYERFSASWIVQLAASDYVDIIDGLQGNGDIHNDYRDFTGFLIG
jgi:C1q-related factor